MAKKKVKEPAKEPKPGKNAKSDPKSQGQGSSQGSGSSQQPGKGAKGDKSDRAGANQQTAEQRKAQRQNLTGLANWTGKLPATLLHEHCQKQKWEKPEYSIRKVQDLGFVASCTLSWHNPGDSNNLVKLEYKLPYLDLKDPEKNVINPVETTNEARHLIATFTLHRLCFDKNIHLMLPPTHKSIWSVLESQRKQMYSKSNRRGADPSEMAKYRQIYNPNPFEYYVQQQLEARRAAKQQQLQQQKQQEAEKLRQMQTKTDLRASLKSGAGHNSSADNHGKDHKVLSPQQQSKTVAEICGGKKFGDRQWQRAPLFDMNSELRVAVESAIKHNIDWESIKDSGKSLENGAKLEQTLVSLGFRRSHVKEALSYTTSGSACLEWLVFHLPEDDLPPAFTKEENEKKVNIKMASNLDLEKHMNVLSDSGFSVKEIVEAYEKTESESEMVLKLCKDLLPEQTALPEPIDPEESMEIWNQEIEALQSVDPEKYSVLQASPDVLFVKLCPQEFNVDIETSDLTLRVYWNNRYPHDVVGLVLELGKHKLASYIKRSIISHTLMQVHEQWKNDGYIYPLVEYIEENMARFVEDPGPLYIAPKNGRKVDHKNNGSGSATSSADASAKKSRRRIHVDVDKVKESYSKRLKSSEYAKSLQQRSKLPAFSMREEILKIMGLDNVTLVTGETGSGKSTQVVQFLLDAMNAQGIYDKRLLVTQPRRISTTSLAQRISDERCDTLGQEVGYMIRGENRTTPATRVTFMTVGVLLRILQNDSNTFLSSVKYILVDEVHERSVDIDFLLIVLKKLAQKFKQLHVVLMSATVDKSIFDSFFGKSIASVHIPGRTFPIQDHYLEDYLPQLGYTITKRKDGSETVPKADSSFFSQGNLNYELIAHLVSHIDKDLGTENAGSVLVFLPGVLEINKCMQAVQSLPNGAHFWTLPLHSALPMAEQSKVFLRSRDGRRKCVFATNVAETSITIPDVVVVIDSGRVKTMHFDSGSKSSRLCEAWCSRAEAKQRRGRAGRIQEGTCYKLYTRETSEQRMSERPVPEILRTSLDSLYLVIKSMGIEKVQEFLSQGIDTPEQKNFVATETHLVRLGALHKSLQLTHLGKFLALLPLELAWGKLLVYGTLFRCLESVLTVAAMGNIGDPFLGSFEHRDAVKEVKAPYQHLASDTEINMLFVEQYMASSKPKQFARDNFLSPQKMKDILSTRQQLLEILQDQGFVPMHYRGRADSLNRNCGNGNVLRNILTSSFYPQIAEIVYPDSKFAQNASGAVEVQVSDMREIKFFAQTPNGVSRAFLHPSSSLFAAHASKILKKSVHTFLVFGQQNYSEKSDKFFLQQVTPVSVWPVLLFGSDVDLSSNGGLVVDESLLVKSWWKNAVLVKYLKRLLDDAIERVLRDPHSGENDEVLKLIEKLIVI